MKMKNNKKMCSFNGDMKSFLEENAIDVCLFVDVIQHNDYKLIVVLIGGYKLVPNCVILKFKLFSFEFLYIFFLKLKLTKCRVKKCLMNFVEFVCVNSQNLKAMAYICIFLTIITLLCIPFSNKKKNSFRNWNTKIS